MTDPSTQAANPQQSQSPEAPVDPAPRFIDWDFATSTARRITPSGPAISAGEAADAVADLRSASRRAHDPVAETARLHTPEGAPPALVVDRPTWIGVNVESFATILDPVIARIVLSSQRPAPPAVVQRIGGKVTGTEVAGLLSFMSTKVLGQYELAPGRPADAARLMLVAPNVVQVERELGVDPRDFRLWVCLHEETHRVQFTAVPWLRDHMTAQTAELAADLAPDADVLLERLKQLAANLPDALRSGGTGLAEVFMTPEQKERVAQVTAVMALLEGHADVVMDDVGPKIVPSVEQIRAKFDRRREGLGALDILLRRLLGLEAKMAQYRDGAAFVRAVTAEVGLDGFNAVWTSPETLPTPEEIRVPRTWVARVHG